MRKVRTGANESIKEWWRPKGKRVFS
jgi:hypothetical protein